MSTGTPTTHPYASKRLDNTYIRQPSPHVSTSSSPNPSGMSTQQQQPPGHAVGAPDQEIIDHASRTMDRLMNRDLQHLSLYKSLIQISDPNSVAGKIET